MAMEPVTHLIFDYFHGMSSLCVCVIVFFILQLTFTNIASVFFHPLTLLSIGQEAIKVMVS